MAYRVDYRGLAVTCDSIAELDRLADRTGESQRSVRAQMSEPKGIDKVLEGLGTGQIAVLRAIAKRGSVSQDDLCGDLDINAKALGAQMSLIAKAMNRAGHQLADVVRRDSPINGSGNPVATYKLTSEHAEKINHLAG